MFLKIRMAQSMQQCHIREKTCPKGRSVLLSDNVDSNLEFSNVVLNPVT